MRIGFQTDFRNNLETLEIESAIERAAGFPKQTVLRQMWWVLKSERSQVWFFSKDDWKSPKRWIWSDKGTFWRRQGSCRLERKRWTSRTDSQMKVCGWRVRRWKFVKRERALTEQVTNIERGVAREIWRTRSVCAGPLVNIEHALASELDSSYRYGILIKIANVQNQLACGKRSETWYAPRK